MGEWKAYKIGDACEILTGFPFKSTDYDTQGPLKVVRGENVTVGTLRWDTPKYWNRSTEGLEKYFLREGDIVIGMDGSKVGQNRAIIRHVELPLILAQRVSRLRSKPGFDQAFMWYQIFNSHFQDYVEATHTGTSIPHISQFQIADFQIQAPPLPVQRGIASLLHCLDDKIDLLQLQNATLDETAQTLFRQWFVKEAAERWQGSSLYDVIELVGGGTPKTGVPEYWGGEIKWISGGDITPNHRRFITETEKTITRLGLERSTTKVLPRFATLISARGTVGKYCLLSEPMAFSQTNYGVIPKIRDRFFFTYLLIAHSVEELQAASYGSVFDTITTNTFREHKIQIPSEDEIREFEEVVKSYLLKMLTNSLQIRTLTKLRNTLLPKLMSAEVTMTA